jgi:hypothetical protein
MKEIGISVSKKQLSRLKNGHSVRVKQGEGLLIVNPDRYDLMSKTFLKGKSHTLALSPEEILLNTRGYQPESHQTNAGYIPKKEDSSRVATAKFSTYKGTPTELSAGQREELERLTANKTKAEKSEIIRKFLKKKVSDKQAKEEAGIKVFEKRLELATKRAEKAREAEDLITFPPPPPPPPPPPVFQSPLFNAYATAQPAPRILPEDLRKSIRGRFAMGQGISKFVSNAGGPRTKNGNYKGNYLLESGLANATAGMVHKEYIKGGIESARRNQMMVGMGMGYGFHRPHTEGVSNRGTILRRGNPALQSQPFSENFNMASQLPPAFQRFHTSV